MRIDARLDAGDVLRREAVAIEPGEHAPALFDRLAAIGAPLLAVSVAGLASGAIEPQPQDDREATFAPLLKREDGWVDPAVRDARTIDGRIRGFDPWPGVWLMRGSRRLRLVRASIAQLHDAAAEPGRLIALPDGGIALRCANGTALRLLEIQPDGRGPLDVADAINGRQLALGERLEPIRSA
jgi:methionyl-tRNA formyltransferase